MFQMFSCTNLLHAMILPWSCMASVRTVLVRNQTEPVMVEEGTMMRMSCRTEREWFFCLWQNPEQERLCAVQEQTMQSVCGENNRIKLLGRGDTCTIEFQESMSSLACSCL